MRALCMLAIVALAAGCRGAGGNQPPRDVLVDKTVAQESDPNRGKCEVGNADGIRCDKRVCKKDETGVGDCADFGKKCIDNGHHYNGTKNEGTCSRVQ